MSSSLINKIQNESAKRLQAAPDLQPAVDEARQVAAPERAPKAQATAGLLRAEPRVQMVQVGHRVPEDLKRRFEAYHERVTAEAYKKGLKSPSLSDLTTAAFELLLQHDPKSLLAR